MPRLFIIGNGFDLAHKLDTTPNRFREILNQGLLQMPNGDLCSWDDFQMTYAPSWSEWEKGLDAIDIRAIDEDNPDGPDYLSDREEDRRGIVDSMEGFAREVTSQITAALHRLVEEANNATSKGLADVTPPGNSRIPFLHDGDVVINFNYTDTVSLLYPARVTMIHIHGRASAGEPLLFGYRADPDLADERDRKRLSYLPPGSHEDPDPLFDVDPYIHQKWAALDDLIDRLEKKIPMDKLRDSLTHFTFPEVYVLGHSLSDVDRPYFEEIDKLHKPHSWYISQYDGDPNWETLRRFTFAARIRTDEMGALTSIFHGAAERRCPAALPVFLR